MDANSFKDYKVVVTETVEKVYIVLAADEDAALEEVEKEWIEEGYLPDATKMVSRELDVYDYEDKWDRIDDRS